MLDDMVERRIEGESTVGLKFQVIERVERITDDGKIMEESVLKLEVCWTREVSGP